MGQSPCKSWVISLSSAVTAKDECQRMNEFSPLQHKSMKYSQFCSEDPGGKIARFFHV